MASSHQARPISGDRLPTQIAAYYEAADAGRVEEAAARLAPDVLVAMQVPGPETAPRLEIRGQSAAQDWLLGRGLAPVVHDVRVCVSDGTDCFVEGLMRRREDGEAVRTYVAGFRLTAKGKIGRYFAYACDPVEGPRGDDTATVTEARPVVERYFSALMAGRFAEAVDQFSADVMYCHPPYQHVGITDSKRLTFNGHAELLAAFEKRGKSPIRHRILNLIQRGSNAMFELVVDNLPNGGNGGSLCSLSLGPDGKIQRYLAFFCEPAVPQT